MTGIFVSGPFYGMPRGRAGVVLADPPWRFATYSNPTSDAPIDEPGARSIHYGRMSRADLLALPVADLCALDAALFLWTTGPHLEQGIELLRAWGFTYAGFGFVWVKATRWGAEFMGMGYGPRANAEIALLGRRGSPKRLDAGVRQLIVSPIGRHSQKPYEAHKRARRLYAGPYVELFARVPRPGWTTWGNELPGCRAGMIWRRDEPNAEQVELACQQAQTVALAKRARVGP